MAKDRTTKGERTKIALVEAATAVFLGKGIFDTRVQDITDAAGVSQGAFYQYFDSKDEILAVAVDHAKSKSLRALSPRLGDKSDPLFIRIGRANRRYISTYQHNANVIRMLEQRVAIDDDFREARRDMHPEFVSRLTRGLMRHQAAGAIDRALDMTLAAPALSSLVDNLSYIAFVLLADEHVDPTVEDAIDAIWANVLGLSWDASDLDEIRTRERPDRPPLHVAAPHDTPDRAAPPPTGRGLRTREDLLTAARSIFERDGYRDATVANITGRAEVAHGTFYRYFDSRFDVFAALVDQLRDGLDAELDQASGDATSTRVALFAGLDRATRFYGRNVRFLAVLEQFATIDRECAGVRLELRKAFVDRVSAAVGKLQDAGEADTRLLPDATAEALVSMFERSMYEWHVLGVPADITAGEAYLPTIWRRALLLDES